MTFNLFRCKIVTTIYNKILSFDHLEHIFSILDQHGLESILQNIENCWAKKWAVTSSDNFHLPSKRPSERVISSRLKLFFWHTCNWYCQLQVCNCAITMSCMLLALPCMLLIYENKLGRKEITEKTERSHLIVLEMTIMMNYDGWMDFNQLPTADSCIKKQRSFLND